MLPLEFVGVVVGFAITGLVRITSLFVCTFDVVTHLLFQFMLPRRRTGWFLAVSKPGGLVYLLTVGPGRCGCIADFD